MKNNTRWETYIGFHYKSKDATTIWTKKIGSAQLEIIYIDGINTYNWQARLDFGELDPEIVNKTGFDRYNFGTGATKTLKGAKAMAESAGKKMMGFFI